MARCPAPAPSPTRPVVTIGQWSQVAPEHCRLRGGHSEARQRSRQLSLQNKTVCRRKKHSGNYFIIKVSKVLKIRTPHSSSSSSVTGTGGYERKNVTDLIRAHEVNYYAGLRRSAAVPGPGRGGGREQNLMKLQPGIKNIVLMHLMDMWTWAGEQPAK